jgi:hypothetical protein
MLRDVVPYLFLGRLVGAENGGVHVFFPHSEVSPSTSILNVLQLGRWDDKTLEPAICDRNLKSAPSRNGFSPGTRSTM